MYTILVNQDRTLTATVKKRIMHRSNLVNKFQFLIDEVYNGYTTRDYTVAIEYVLPISKHYTIEILSPSDELYKGKLQYLLPIDTKLTSEVGEVEIKLIMTQLIMDENGNISDPVERTDMTKVNILPTELWEDYIASSDLGSVAQMLLQTQSTAEQLKAYADMLTVNKADNIVYDKETNSVQLLAVGNKIGTPAKLGDNKCECNEEGIPAVDFSDLSEPDEPTVAEVNNVVEF